MTLTVKSTRIISIALFMVTLLLQPAWGQDKEESEDKKEPEVTSPGEAAPNSEAKTEIVDPIVQTISTEEKKEPEKKKSWTDMIKPDLKAFVYWKMDASDGADYVNEFGVGRAYFGAKVYPVDHFMFRLTFDAKARVKTAKGSSETETVEVKDEKGDVIGTADVPVTSVDNSQGAYSAYLKYAYLEAYDVFTKGLKFRLGQGGFIGITQLEDYWTYRYQGPMILDREKYMSSTYIGFSVAYKAPNKTFQLQLSAVNGEGYSHPERQKSKDGQFAIFTRPWAEKNGFLHSLVFGGMVNYGKYDDADGIDRRVRAGLTLGMAEKLYCLFTEIDFVQDPTVEAASRAKKIAGMDTPLAAVSDDMTSGFLAAVYAWIDFGLFADEVKGLRLMGRYDYADPDINFGNDAHHRVVAGVGYVFNKHFQILADTEFTIFSDKSGYDKNTGVYVKPTTERLVYLHTQIKL